MAVAANFNAIIPEMLALLIFGIVFATIAILKFRTDAE